MKNQYFGDINDFRKYGLLRLLSSAGDLRIGVCWMLTPDDGRTDGEFRRYLESPAGSERHDPELHRALSRLLEPGRDRSVQHAEEWQIVPDAKYHRAIVPEGAKGRDGYFADVWRSLAGTDLIFFDPDNGIEVKSVSRTSRQAPKYVYWSELAEAHARGHSVLVYQHYPRSTRPEFENRISAQLRDVTGAPGVHLFSTAHVAFLAAAQPAHSAAVEAAARAVEGRWAGQIRHRIIH